MRINEIPQVAAEYDNDFIFAFCTFLDEFYAADGKEKALSLSDEPKKSKLNQKQYCTLAAAAHKLANDYGLTVPAWVMQDKFKMPRPVYAFNTSKPEHQEFLRTVTPEEYKMRNLFSGDNVLKRV
jgi:hypothetical protein